MKTFGGHILLTNTTCFLLKNDCDEKKKKKTLIDRGESYPGFKCQGWFLENMGNTNL